MKKILTVLLILFAATNGYCADVWDKDGVAPGTQYVDECFADTETNFKAIDKILATFRQGCRISYSSAAEITVELGEVMCSNSAGTIRHMCRNTSDTTVAWTDIDTGSESASTTYYLYAVSDGAADTFTVTISASSSAPTGDTYYQRLGSFYNNASSNITRLNNDGFYANLGTWESKSDGVTYQALTDGFFIGYGSGSPNSSVKGYTDSSSTPTTIRGYNSLDDQNSTGRACVTVPVKSGDYWKTSGASVSVYWIPTE